MNEIVHQKGDCTMSDEIKKLGPEGVSALWTRVFELVKLLTGDVDTSEGTLQEQINSHTADTDMHVTQEEKERWDAGGSGGDTTAIEEMLWQGQIAAECQLSDDSQLVTSDGESILLTKKI